MCVKYGTKYGADYVNKLYQGVKDNLSLPHKFACFTEDGSGLDPNVQVIDLENKHWGGWWSKVNIFNGESYKPFMPASQEEDKPLLVLYIDLDMIITGSIDSLILSFEGKFTTLTTDDIFCE